MFEVRPRYWSNGETKLFPMCKLYRKCIFETTHYVNSQFTRNYISLNKTRDQFCIIMMKNFETLMHLFLHDFCEWIICYHLKISNLFKYSSDSSYNF